MQIIQNKKIIKISLFIFFVINTLLLSACKSSTNNEEKVITVSGSMRYQDRLYNKTGFFGTKYLPVRNAMVDAIDKEGQVIASSVTDNNGDFLFTDISNNAISVSVRAENKSRQHQLKINNTSAAVYAVSADIDKSTQSTSVNIEIDISHPAAGAFNMFDLYEYAFEYSQRLSPVDQVFSLLNVYWTKGSSRYGTYMCLEKDNDACRFGVGIYVLSGQYDTDEYDDDVLLHEFSHYLEYFFNSDGSPGGPHVFTDNDLDLRLSWSEGWGNYISLAVKGWLSKNKSFALSASQAPNESLTRYIDTDTSVQGTTISFDFLNPDNSLCGNTDCYIYASNEVAIANMLFNISQQLGGEQSIWDVLSGDLPTLNIEPITQPINAEPFWDYLILNKPIQEQASLLNILLSRKINYYLDSFEPDNDISELTSIDCLAQGICINKEFHTLYGNTVQADIDWVAVNLQAGQAYSFETTNLTNGADTYLKLLDTNGSIVEEDDDRADSLGNEQALSCSSETGILTCPHNGYNFSSQIKYTPAVTAVYYLSISVPDEIYTVAYDMMGRYGGYELTVRTLP